MIDQAVILAGGLGSRLGELTQQMPKPLLPVAGRPFLEYVVWNLSRFGINRFLFSVGYRADQIIEHFGDGSRFGISTDYVVEQQPLNTGGALLFAGDKLQKTFLVANGDTLFDLNYLDLALLLRQNSTLGGLALRHLPETRQYGEVRVADQLITEFSEKTGHGPGLVNGGVYVMQRQILDQIPRQNASLERDLFPLLVAKQELAGKPYHGFFIDIGVPESLLQAHSVLPPWKRRAAVFLDRDGVLNVDRGYVHNREEFAWLEGAPAAVKWLNDHGYLVIVVTNQAGIARGYYSEKEFLSFTGWINKQLQMDGAHLDATYYCPHHPFEGRGVYKRTCECRKPASGLIRRALAEWDIDLQRSLMIGNNESDLLAAQDVGLLASLFEGGDLLSFVKSSVTSLDATNE